MPNGQVANYAMLETIKLNRDAQPLTRALAVRGRSR
jgi:hypothetical protein